MRNGINRSPKSLRSWFAQTEYLSANAKLRVHAAHPPRWFLFDRDTVHYYHLHLSREQPVNIAARDAEQTGEAM
jgi:hypothetical protein